MKVHKPTSPGRRGRVDIEPGDLVKKRPERRLVVSLKRKTGRSLGRVTVRHRGGGEKRLYRRVDFKRGKEDIKAKVAALEYDPNRGANLALLIYADGEKRYILAPLGLKAGDEVLAGGKASLSLGNALPLSCIPVGTVVHNLELQPGKGGQLVRGAGTGATVMARDGGRYVQVKLPSGEIRKILSQCTATIGQLGNVDRKNIKLGKAGRKRHWGIRPTVRGVAQHPDSHPHGGGEGRSGIGMPSPKTPWGKPALGKKTRRRKYTDKYIIKRRR